LPYKHRRDVLIEAAKIYLDKKDRNSLKMARKLIDESIEIQLQYEAISGVHSRAEITLTNQDDIEDLERNVRKFEANPADISATEKIAQISEHKAITIDSKQAHLVSEQRRTNSSLETKERVLGMESSVVNNSSLLVPNNSENRVANSSNNKTTSEVRDYPSNGNFQNEVSRKIKFKTAGNYEASMNDDIIWQSNESSNEGNETQKEASRTQTNNIVVIQIYNTSNLPTTPNDIFPTQTYPIFDKIEDQINYTELPFASTKQL